MKIQMCSVPRKHETPSVANLARGLPIGLAEPLWEPRCSLRRLPPNLPTPLLPRESDLCFHLKALSAFSCSPFLCPSQLFTLSCTSYPILASTSWRTRTNNDLDFYTVTQNKIKKTCGKNNAGPRVKKKTKPEMNKQTKKTQPKSKSLIVFL